MRPDGLALALHAVQTANERTCQNDIDSRSRFAANKTGIDGKPSNFSGAPVVVGGDLHT